MLVSEDEISNSMIALIQRNKVVTEGAGALACAALLSGKIRPIYSKQKNRQASFPRHNRSSLLVLLKSPVSLTLN
ncbi:hypothetical protein ACNKHU_19225 [Shigella flexneri]